MNSSKRLDLLLYLWYIIFFISMICCFRAISSIGIGLIFFTGLLKNKIETGSWLNKNLNNSLLLTCCLFYLVQLFSLLYSSNIHESLKNLQTKTAMLFVPLAICCSSYLNKQVRQDLMKYYTWILVATLLFCLIVALNKYYFAKAESSVFFYHDLVAPLKQHAVQVSIFIFAGLIYLLEKTRKGSYLHNKPVHFLLIVYFTCFILLLSSKLVIIFTAGCFVYYIIRVLIEKLNSRFIIFTSLFAGLVMIILILSTQNRISSRFNEITTGDMKLIQQQKFDPGIYFNGVQFRLLEYRFVKEILTEKHAWLIGVSNKAQILLDEKYISTHMYIGDGKTADRGYLGYNTHDQFLESLLRSGIPGLFSFLLICFSLIQMAIRKKNTELTIIIIILIAYCFNESVFERQYGITLFTFFPLFIYYGSGKRTQAGNNRHPQKNP